MTLLINKVIIVLLADEGDSVKQSSEQLVAHAISYGFPSSELRTINENGNLRYQIFLDNELLIEIDDVGMTVNFPTNQPSKRPWRGVMEGGPEIISEMVLQELADAGFEVFKRIKKSRINVGKHTLCPACKARGQIRITQYAPYRNFNNSDWKIKLDEPPSTERNRPEIRCLGCGWDGELEDVRFNRTKD